MSKEPEQPEDRYPREVRDKEQRKLRARGREERSVWFWLGMFGLVGWTIAIPTVAGIAIGLWMDRTWAGPPSWTLTMMFIGLAIGCLGAWYWVRKESRRE